MARDHSASSSNGPLGAKRSIESTPDLLRPAKRRKALLEVDDSERSRASSPSGGVAIGDHAQNDAMNGFSVNEDFARRFEHNKRREELQRCTPGHNLSWPIC